MTTSPPPHLTTTDRINTSTPIAASVPVDDYGPSYFSTEHELQQWLSVVDDPAVTVWDLDRLTGEWVTRTPDMCAQCSRGHAAWDGSCQRHGKPIRGLSV